MKLEEQIRSLYSSDHTAKQLAKKDQQLAKLREACDIGYALLHGDDHVMSFEEGIKIIEQALKETE